MNDALVARGVVKRFGGTVALDGLDLRVPAGGVYGLLGPNGAGKTTAIRLLAGLLRPDAGTVEVLGRAPAAARGLISLTGQYAAVDDDLTGRENLELLGRLLGLGRRAARDRADALLAEFGLADAGGRQVKGWSGGMRRRLDIAAGLVVPPRLLFLDEPTTGLDPRSRAQVWGMVRALVADGTTVLLTTQYLDEADALADRIAVLDAGRVVAEGTTDELKASVGAGAVRVRLADAADGERAAALLASRLGVPVAPPGDRELVARTDAPAAAILALEDLRAAGIPVADFSLGRPGRDEVFLALTGGPR